MHLLLNVFVLMASSQNIENREEKDPHDVHKMPVQTGAFEETVVVRTNLASKRFEKRRDQQQDADKNVHAVKSRKNEETGSHDPGGVKPKTFVMQVNPLKCLVRQEK